MQNTLTERIAGRIDRDETRQMSIGRNGAIDLTSASHLMEFAKMMAIAGVAIPKHLRDNPGACMAVSIQANEWRMSPFAVANKSYSVNDRLAYEAQLINAVILQRAPIKGRFRVNYTGEGPKRKCRVEVTLNDGDLVEYESPETGTITVKNSPLWKSDPDQQLFYYSSRALCRRHFPDVLLGVYAPEEIEEAPERLATGREVTGGMASMLSGEAEPAKERPATTQTFSAQEQIIANLEDRNWSDGEFMDAARQMGITPADGFDGISVIEWARAVADWDKLEAQMVANARAREEAAA